ncbi:restriction endonuclease subunit S [Psychrobacter sp. F1192]|uniref:Restriction endonuclease subunit S n=2 Tax=Psychrobacter coccoides TaxID=2818440 RepID=A0ABS3NME1_9GAMM|nr:restriction endonuclease subunit S [Psychrobacter coccoides]
MQSGRYQAYPEYKDSGVEWLREVPAHWISTQVKYGYTVVLGKMLQTTRKTTSDLLKPYLKAQNIQPSGIDLTNVSSMWFSADERKRLLLKKNDILVSEGGDVGRAAIWDNEIDECYIQNAINRVRPRYTNDSRFFYYWINYLKSTDFINIICNKATISHYTADKLQGSPLILPPVLEQKKIANFLDFETAKIDTLIEKQQRLIELLTEKRQAVISHAVTKGLNPEMPMKDSGVEWLGEVPEHWDILAISKVTKKITNGYVGATRDILVPKGVPYIQATHVKRGGIHFDGSYFVREEWSKKHSKSILEEGDVLVVQTGAGTGDIGLVTDKEAGFNCHALIILQPKNELLIGEYLSLTLQTDYGYAFLYSIRTGGMHPHLNCGEVRYVQVPIPTLKEQREIVNYIYERTKKYDLIIERAKQAIQLMQERRTALISAAVTGKIDVREWVQPE